MGSNAEIRQRMETYHAVLLTVVWIGAIVGVIGGMIMISYESGGYWSSGHPLRPYGIAVLIVSIIGGIIGHFLVNVGLAIPFILLNNGDILESMKKNVKGNISDSGNSSLAGSPSNTNSGSSNSSPINTYVPSFMRQEEKPVSFVERPKAAIYKKCTKCKKEVDEDCEKCPHCGNKIFE
jgi:hypothetical protein